MSPDMEAGIKGICSACENRKDRLMDIVNSVQAEIGYVPGEVMELIADLTGVARIQVESLVSFYSFLGKTPTARTIIRVCNSIVEEYKGCRDVAQAFCDELNIVPGQASEDGQFLLVWASCIGMSDQAPAVLINQVVFNSLTPEKARDIAVKLKHGKKPEELSAEYAAQKGEGQNAGPYLNSMVQNNIRRIDEILFASYQDGDGLKAALNMEPAVVIDTVKQSNLRGRGGAGFPTGLKWTFTSRADGEKFVLCNADEGEPGTFKDRVLLTEKPDLIFEGMTIAGYALGSRQGIVYLRGEYAYMRTWLEKVLEQRRNSGCLGKNICGREGFDFDIRIQMGAGAYVCGEETALISSCEGKRGDPRTRPPFPAARGYLDCPTVVNNVETFCCVPRILEKGPQWFAGIGSNESSGTKLLSVSGDCANPGVFEIPFGTSIRSVLDMAGASQVQAVQIGGPSGSLISPEHFERTVDFADFATGGSFMIFDNTRNILDIVRNFMDFFVHESCGFCTPCRAGNVIINRGLQRFIDNRAAMEDMEDLVELGSTVKATSRCGLGQTSPNPVLTAMQNFPQIFESRTVKPVKGRIPSFDLAAAVREAEEITGRRSLHAHDDCGTDETGCEACNNREEGR